MKLGIFATGAALLFAGMSFIPAHAQIGRSFDLQMRPTQPGPYETVEIYAETYSFDISRAQVRWTVNGSVFREGIGIREIEIETGAIGERTTVGFSASLNGENLSRTLSISPSVVDLIVEAQTYTPPFYKGGALPVHESTLRIVAMPTMTSSAGTTYGNDQLIFTWRDGTRVLQEASGVGENVLTISAENVYGSKNIRVDVESIDRTARARGETRIETESPLVLLYQVEPLQGVEWGRALSGEIEFQEDEVTLVAEPYYFPAIARPALEAVYNWSLNGNDVESGSADPGTITLRQAGEGRGRARVEMTSYEPAERLIQDTASVIITFGEESENIFGL